MFLGLQLELEKVYNLYHAFCTSLSYSGEAPLQSFGELHVEDQEGWKRVLQLGGSFFEQNRQLLNDTYLSLEQRLELTYNAYNAFSSAFPTQASDNTLNYLQPNLQQAWGCVTDELFKIYKDMFIPMGSTVVLDVSPSPITLAPAKIQAPRVESIKMTQKKLPVNNARVDYSKSGLTVQPVRTKVDC